MMRGHFVRVACSLLLVGVLGPGCGGSEELRAEAPAEVSTSGAEELPSPAASPCAWVPRDASIVLDLNMHRWRRWTSWKRFVRMGGPMQSSSGVPEPLFRLMAEQADRLLLFAPSVSPAQVLAAQRGELGQQPLVVVLVQGPSAMGGSLERVLRQERARDPSVEPWGLRHLGPGLWALAHRRRLEPLEPQAGCWIEEGRWGARLAELPRDADAYRMFVSGTWVDALAIEEVLLVMFPERDGLRLLADAFGSQEDIAFVERNLRDLLGSSTIRLGAGLLGLSEALDRLRITRRPGGLRLQVSLTGEEMERLTEASRQMAQMRAGWRAGAATEDAAAGERTEPPTSSPPASAP